MERVGGAWPAVQAVSDRVEFVLTVDREVGAFRQIPVEAGQALQMRLPTVLLDNYPYLLKSAEFDATFALGG
jgi:hypothetical protein